MAKKLLTALTIIMFVAGLGLLLFPPISNFIGKQIANSEADKFDTRLENIIDDGSSYNDALNDGKLTRTAILMTATSQILPYFSKPTSTVCIRTAWHITKTSKQSSMSFCAMIHTHRRL